MSFIDKIRQQPQATKLKIIWGVSIAIVIVLIIVWAISSHYSKSVAKDTTFFQTLGQGFHDVKENFK